MGQRCIKKPARIPTGSGQVGYPKAISELGAATRLASSAIKPGASRQHARAEEAEIESKSSNYTKC
jgi:hypothetical protein